MKPSPIVAAWLRQAPLPALSLVALVLLAPPHLAQQFGPAQPVIESAEGVEAAIAADIDGDGDQDVLAALFYDNGLAWWENSDGLGGFGPKRVISTGDEGARSVFAADLDGDGDQDALVAAQLDDRIAWFENTDGQGSFAKHPAIDTVCMGARWVHAADLDGDGDRDVLAAGWDGGRFIWYENTDGLGSFGPRQQIAATGNGATSVIAADMDGDGDQDVFGTNYVKNRIWSMENLDGLGSFGTVQLVTDKAAQPQQVVARDLDGDADQDLLVASRFNHTIAWYANSDGLGTYGPKQVISSSALYASSVFAADLDGDGDSDVLSASSNDDKIAWYENANGLGSFGAEQVLSATCEEASWVAAADFDGDGDPDVLSAALSPGNIYWQENTDGLGSFGAQETVSASASALLSLAAADLDGDGDEDLLSASLGDHKLAWYENLDGQGTFSQQQVISYDALQPNFVNTADLDGDGDPDMVYGASIFDELGWFENLGPGSFGSRQVVSSALEYIRCADSADLDGDGDADLVVASEYDDKLDWYENLDGLGSFGSGQALIGGFEFAGPFWVTPADLDGDGDPDLLAAAADADMVAWFNNTNGQGDFGPRRIITPTCNGARSVCAADLDGDGDLDAASASYYDNKLAWYENTDGLAHFGPEIVVGGVQGAQSVRAADFDADGDQDLVGAAFLGDRVVWFANEDGLGNFGGAANLTTALAGPIGVLAVDLDGDGYDDVVAGAFWAGAIEWFENRQQALIADHPSLSLSAGGTQRYSLTAGATHGLELYLLLGSLSGTAPGLVIDGHRLPLNPDAYFLYTLAHPNSSIHVNTLGNLSAHGTGTATFKLPPGSNPALAGATLHHAYATFDLAASPGNPFLSLASNAVSLTLLP